MTKVELEFKRIQTYLFASPRLRAMLGANASLGKTIRIELLHTAKQSGAMPDDAVINKLPVSDKHDPIEPDPKYEDLADNPREIYRKFGVLVRDGGHFIATFEKPEKARLFVQSAIALIAEKLPGILVAARIDGHEWHPHDAQASSEGESLFQHPGFQVSQHLGNQPAAYRDKKGFVGTNESAIEQHGKTFRDNPKDLIGYMEHRGLIPHSENTVQSLDQLSKSGYIALIHADGNSIGSRYQAWRKKCTSTAQDLEKEAHGEHFFHSMRVAVRAALQNALKETFSQAPECYQLLMLGGDDLLLACAASHALTFVRNYAQALKNFNLADGEPLTIGAGVVIAKDKFPFHRLHAMAEELASSAKQLSRAKPEVGSVVDWHITSNAWVNDPIAQRMLGSLTDSAVLSCKPYPVLGAQSTATLLDCAERSGGYDKLARSQLRKLVNTMRQGQTLAELAFSELPEALHGDLNNLFKDFDYPNSNTPSPFKKINGETPCTTFLPDLVEILEIGEQPRKAGQGARA